MTATDTAASPDPAPGMTEIAPARGWRGTGLRELISSRELLYILVWRDIRVRYKQTLVGLAWVIIQPLAIMIVFTVFLGQLAGLSGGGVPYAIFVYGGFIPWNYFTVAITESANSLLSNSHLISKVYFSRMTVPLAPIISSAVDMAVTSVILVVLAAVWYGVAPGPELLALPLAAAHLMLFTLGLGLWLAAINLRYRDVQYALPFVLQLTFFLTPIIYPTSLLEEPWRTVYSINPLVSIVDTFRWCLVGGPHPGPGLLLSLTLTAVVLVSGIWFFRRMEPRFEDFV